MRDMVDPGDEYFLKSTKRQSQEKFLILNGNNQKRLPQTELAEIERGWRALKSTLLLRPVHHWTEDRIKAHVFICVLALQIERVMRNRLKTLSVSKALDRLRRIKVGEIKFGNIAAIKSG